MDFSHAAKQAGRMGTCFQWHTGTGLNLFPHSASPPPVLCPHGHAQCRPGLPPALLHMIGLSIPQPHLPPVLSHSFASWKCCSLTSWGWSHRVSMHRLASNPTHQAASVPAAEGLAHLKLGTDRTALLWDYCCSSFTVPAAVQHPVKSHKYQGHQVSSNCVLKGLMVSAHYSRHNFQLANHRITEL